MMKRVTTAFAVMAMLLSGGSTALAANDAPPEKQAVEACEAAPSDAAEAAPEAAEPAPSELGDQDLPRCHVLPPSPLYGPPVVT